MGFWKPRFTPLLARSFHLSRASRLQAELQEAERARQQAEARSVLVWLEWLGSAVWSFGFEALVLESKWDNLALTRSNPNQTTNSGKLICMLVVEKHVFTFLV